MSRHCASLRIIILVLIILIIVLWRNLIPVAGDISSEIGLLLAIGRLVCLRLDLGIWAQRKQRIVLVTRVSDCRLGIVRLTLHALYIYLRRLLLLR